MPVLVSRTITTAPGYTDTNSVEARGARTADITVSDRAVYMQIAYEQAPGMIGSYGQEERVLPRSLIITDEPIFGIRFRSALTDPGTVDVTLST